MATPSSELHDEVVSLDSAAPAADWYHGEVCDGRTHIYAEREHTCDEDKGCNCPDPQPIARDVPRAAARLIIAYRRLAPELARRLRAAEEELAEVCTALDVPAGDICEAIEELQRTAAARRGA